MLEKADADGDGKVNREEMRALRKAHASGDGKKRRGWHKVRKSGDTDADKTRITILGQVPDEELMRLVQTGDQQAYARLLDRLSQ